jgi:hypothetical protein
MLALPMTTAPAALLPASGARPSRARRWLLACAAAAFLGYLAVELWELGGGLGWPLDDSWIHLQFARNLAAGRGLSYNPGELVTGSTAPLWTALLALLAYLPGNPLAWVQLLGGLLYLASIDATYRLARELGLSAGLAALAAGLTLGTGWMVWSALSGMEVPLFATLSLWGMILHLRERAADLAAARAAEAATTTTRADGEPATRAMEVAVTRAQVAVTRVDVAVTRADVPLAAAVLALAALARPEGLLLLLLALLDRCLLFTRDGGPETAPASDLRGGPSGESPPGKALRGLPDVHRLTLGGRRPPLPPLRWRRPPLARLAVGGLLAVCALAGPLLFYRLAGGSFLPTTYAAKGGQVRHWLPDMKYVYTVLGMFLRSQPYMTVLCCGGAARLVARLGSPRDRGLLPGLWLVTLPLVYSTFSPAGPRLLIGNFGRYYFPIFPVVVLLGTLALESAAAALRPGVQAGRFRLPVAALLVALLLWPTASELVDRAGFYSRNLADVERSDVRAARWLAPRLPAGAVLAVIDIGAVKYLLPNRIVDLAGIADPELRREVRREVARGVPFARAMAAAVARRRPDYLIIFPAWLPHFPADLALREVLRLRLEQNVTMGSDELVVYATPWNRYPLRRLPGDPG